MAETNPMTGIGVIVATTKTTTEVVVNLVVISKKEGLKIQTLTLAIIETTGQEVMPEVAHSIQTNHLTVTTLKKISGIEITPKTEMRTLQIICTMLFLQEMKEVILIDNIIKIKIIITLIIKIATKIQGAAEMIVDTIKTLGISRTSSMTIGMIEVTLTTEVMTIMTDRLQILTICMLITIMITSTKVEGMTHMTTGIMIHMTEIEEVLVITMIEGALVIMMIEEVLATMMIGEELAITMIEEMTLMTIETMIHKIEIGEAQDIKTIEVLLIGTVQEDLD